MKTDLLIIEKLIYERWGGASITEDDVAKPLAHIARREGWSFEVVEEVSACASNYRGLAWLDHWGGVVGWSLHCGNIAAVSASRPCWGLPPEFHLISQGPLWEALGADGSFVLPNAAWLLAPLSEADRAALRQSGDGWEVYNFKHWKPYTRAEALFTHWD